MTQKQKEILKPIHISEETAFIVDDYPYGFRLRCKIRYWLEWNKRGVRFCSQTSNPKRPGLVWNKPKKSTYSDLEVLYLNEEGQVRSAAYSYTWGDQEKLDSFLGKYREGLPDSEQVKEGIKMACIAYEARKYIKVTVGPVNSKEERQTEEEKKEVTRKALMMGAVDFQEDGGII